MYRPYFIYFTNDSFKVTKVTQKVTRNVTKIKCKLRFRNFDFTWFLFRLLSWRHSAVADLKWRNIFTFDKCSNSSHKSSHNSSHKSSQSKKCEFDLIFCMETNCPSPKMSHRSSSLLNPLNSAKTCPLSTTTLVAKTL